MLPEVRRWLRTRSSHASRWPVPLLLAAKRDTRVSVVLPARDEQETIGEIIKAIRDELVLRHPLVDEIVVIDSRSGDATARVAAAAGARVVCQDDILPELPREHGKGEALWKSLAATSGDILVFVDADLHDFTPHYITGLLGPLLTDPSVAYVKAYYDRPLHTDGERAGAAGGTGADPGTGVQGGRVTELVARPLLNLHWPLLAGFVQPLSGEYAGRREVLERVPFVTGYGVELALLIDLLDLVGLDALAQVDLGSRAHSHQSTLALGRMASQILLTAWSRLARRHLVVAAEQPCTLLTQFRRTSEGHEPDVHDVSVAERPPMAQMPGYPVPAR